jgi:hypothetical protein
MTPATDTQIDLFAWARDLERENKRIAKVNEERADPSKDVDSAEHTSRCSPPRPARPTRRSRRSGRWPRVAGCGRS